ncbi:MAG TPA: guanylate kinase [Microbacteriaceae bacterium]|nr:guanylate kinase [Microbacteriaceae bacterium]
MPAVDRQAASRAAVAARRARAVVKNSVQAGQLRPLDVLRDARRQPEGTAGRLRVEEFLRSIRGIGPRRAADVLAELRISRSRRLGGLGRHQAARLGDWLTKRLDPDQIDPSRLVVLAGPTAVGKGTVASYIHEHYPDVLLSVSATTRAPRPGERDGVDYFFVDDARFDRMIEAGEFLEWATVHNSHRYGTPRGPVEAALAAGRSVLLEIDLHGARSVRRAMPGATLVFLAPPSWKELVRRLVGRGTEGEAERARRLATARVELAAKDEFDHRVVNDSVPAAAAEVVKLMAVRDSAPQQL